MIVTRVAKGKCTCLEPSHFCVGFITTCLSTAACCQCQHITVSDIRYFTVFYQSSYNNVKFCPKHYYGRHVVFFCCQNCGSKLYFTWAFLCLLWSNLFFVYVFVVLLLLFCTPCLHSGSDNAKSVNCVYSKNLVQYTWSCSLVDSQSLKCHNYFWKSHFFISKLFELSVRFKKVP